MPHETANRPIPLYRVNAFTQDPFGGNPAAVCFIDREVDASVFQSIAAELNLSETAFVTPVDNAPLRESDTFSLRWFTPKVEVPLCGHATLAAAAVLFDEIGIGIDYDHIRFRTKSGPLIATRNPHGIALDLPIDRPVAIDPPRELLDAIGITDLESGAYSETSKKLLVHVVDPGSLKRLRPDYDRLLALSTPVDIRGVIVTAPGGGGAYDFISRYYAPWVGVNEDPVTGSAHTILAPYWSERLAKNEMRAYQASERGGELIVRLGANERDRVLLIGNTVIVFKGELYL